jgi:hypothetical protein
MSRTRTRRSFFCHAGAALAAPFAATAAFAGEHGMPYAATRVAALEDAAAIRALQQRFARLVGTGKTVAALFADPSRAALDTNVRSVIIDGDDAIELSSGGTATARAPCIVTTATPIENCGTLVEMARLQGDGIVARSERRMLETSYVKRGGVWKIDRVTYGSA